MLLTNTTQKPKDWEPFAGTFLHEVTLGEYLLRAKRLTGECMVLCSLDTEVPPNVGSWGDEWLNQASVGLQFLFKFPFLDSTFRDD